MPPLPVLALLSYLDLMSDEQLRQIQRAADNALSLPRLTASERAHYTSNRNRATRTLAKRARKTSRATSRPANRTDSRGPQR